MSLQIPEGIGIRDLIVHLVKQDQDFTDIEIEENEEVAWHIPFGFKSIGGMVVYGRKEIEDFLTEINDKWQKIMDEGDGSFDHATVTGNSTLRIHAAYTLERSRISLSIRKHPLQPTGLDGTPLSENAKKFLNLSSRGLYIVTGATGSAKTTTLAAIVEFFNKTATLNGQPRRSKIVTIEDPIEYKHTRQNAIIAHKSVGPGKDTPSFAQGLKAALREKPDIIMIGEVRDRETAEVMLHAAESGHLIFATMHTNSAVSAISKILSYFPDDEKESRLLTLSNILIGVTSQVMMPMSKTNKFKVIGETLLNNTDVAKKMIAENKIDDLQKYLENSKDGSTSLNTQLLKLYQAGEISGEVAVKAAYNSFQMLMDIQAKKAA